MVRVRIRCYFYDLKLDIPIEFPWQLFIDFQIKGILERVIHNWVTEQQQAASNSVLKESISHRLSRYSVIYLSLIQFLREVLSTIYQSLITDS